jgi:hypothetical protein
VQRVAKSSARAVTGERVPVRVVPRAAAELAPPEPLPPSSEHAARPSGDPPAPHAAAVVLPAPSPGPALPALRDSAAVAALPLPAEGGPFVARPAPTRTAVMAAYGQAVQRAPAPAPASPAVAVLTGTAPLMRSPLSRVETTSEPPAPPRDEPPAAEPPDLDLLAEYVLERLRHELRDGRERLGFLLDDTR